MKRALVLAMIFLLAPVRADAGKSNFFKTTPCSDVPAITLVQEPDTVFVPVPVAMNIFKAKSEQAYVLAHILKGKPCIMPGRIRYQGQCYTAENLRLVKRP